MARLPYKGAARRFLQASVVLLALLTFAVPIVTVLISDTASVDTLWTALRASALAAFTVLFWGIVTGSFRSFFVLMFKPRLAHRAHLSIGLVGFSLAAAHGLCAFFFGVAGYRTGVLWMGPIVLSLLAVVIATALMRARLQRWWRWVHRINYLIFAAVVVHGAVLGTDLWSEPMLRAWSIACSAVVVVGLVWRTDRPTRRRDSRVRRRQSTV
jgi:DMSO/TMAO reductase YedYZ heme-binding membrane subunit